MIEMTIDFFQGTDNSSTVAVTLYRFQNNISKNSFQVIVACYFRIICASLRIHSRRFGHYLLMVIGCLLMLVSSVGEFVGRGRVFFYYVFYSEIQAIDTAVGTFSLHLFVVVVECLEPCVFRRQPL